MAEHEPMTTDLSPDIALFHILPRLPAKSVTRFKCVSKQWHSFIATPAFPKMHLHNQNQHKFLFLPNNMPWDFFTIDCETPEDGCTAFRPLPFMVRSGQELSIAASFQGMVCVVLTKPVDIILWNPVTGDYKTFSKVGSHNDCYDYKTRYGLYYSSSEDDYKLVCLTRYPFNVYIYSLKSDSWRKVDSAGKCYDGYSYIPKRSFLFNERFYFANSYLIKMFDTQTEKLRDIKTPHFVNPRTFYVGFMVARDCIHLYVAIHNAIGQCNTIEQWRMDGDGDWTMVETCSSEQHLYWSYHEQQFCHLMRNGNWLMYSEKDLMMNKNWVINNAAEGCVYVLDAKKHTKEIMCSFKRAFRPLGKYIESFVSPNQYLK